MPTSSSAEAPRLACTVRGCGAPLARDGAAWRCPRGHAFDVARRGWVSLLQPQDRRSPRAGDSAKALAARARCLDAGLGDALLRALREAVASLALPPRPAVLDVGCGDGFFLAGLAAALPIVACGVDLSAAAVDRAARRLPEAQLVVANADRALPWTDASFHLALSVTARRPAEELRRVLVPDGRLLVAVPAEDDLVELRLAVLGEGRLRGRLSAVEGELAGRFVLESKRTARERRPLSREQVADVLAATYRGARQAQRERAQALGAQEVTLAADLGVFRPEPRLSATTSPGPGSAGR